MAPKKDEKKPAAPARSERPARNQKPEPAAEPETAQEESQEPGGEEPEEASEHLQALIDAADNLNSVLGLDPPIDIDASEEDLKANIAGEAKLIGVDTETNKVKDAVIAADKKALKTETWELLDSLGFLAHLKPAKEDKKGAAAKKDDKKGATKPAAKAAPAKKATEPRYTRATAFADAADTGETNIEKLIAKSDELYAKNTGRGANPKEAKWAYNTVTPYLVALGLAKIDGDKIIIQEAAK